MTQRRTLFVFALATALRAAAPCPAPHDLPPGASLEDLASRYLGGPRYAIAIALATNARTGDGFPYIPNPDDLSGVTRVCVPSKSESRRLTRSWEAYERAVALARLPRMAAVSKTLVTIPADQPVNVVAWVRKDQADRLKTASGEWITTTAADTWVTAEPHLQEFCRTFVREHGISQLTQRLEQRLGLSPESNKAFFVRMRLDQPGPEVIFRPCADPATDHAGCTTGPPAKSKPSYLQWFEDQYYSSYGQSLISEFPWTALGYTFDWAPMSGKGSSFARIGESEFVVRKNAPIDVLDVIPTAQYCAAQ
jgi:hypothetical protein